MKTKRTHLTSHERQTIKNMLDKRESRLDICISEEEIYGAEILKALEVTRIAPNDITLLPELLK